MNGSTGILTTQLLTTKLLTLDASERIASLISLSKHFNQCSDNQIAMSYAQTAYDEAFRLGAFEQIANAFIQIGTVYLSEMKYEQSESSFIAALELFRKTGNRTGEANCQFHLGKNFWICHKNVLAQEHFELALSLYQELEDKQELYSCLKHLGETHYEFKNYSLALRHYFEAYNLAQTKDSCPLTAALLINIGNVLIDLVRCSEALEYFQDALVLTNQTGDKYQTNEVLYGIGIAYFLQDKYEEAKAWFEKNQIIADEITDRVAQRRIELYLRDIQLQTERKPEKAVDNADGFLAFDGYTIVSEAMPLAA